MRRAFLVIVLAACGSSSRQQLDASMHGSDASIDAPDQCATARIVPEDERTPMLAHAPVPLPPPAPDGGIIVDGGGIHDAGGSTCNPLAQTGCPGAEKCTWIANSYVGCAPSGTVATGGACTANA